MTLRAPPPIMAAVLLGLCAASTVHAQTPYEAVAAEAPTPPDVQIEALNARLDQAEQALANHRTLLAQARSEIALKDELIVLGRERNGELYAIAQEILARYGDVDFREVLSRREPFVQTARVRLENRMQDYEDRLRAARVYETTLPPSVERRMQQELDQRRSAEAAATPDTAAPTPTPAPPAQ